MSQYLCHDFKTPRTNTSRRLPNSFRFVPFAFYLALVAGTYFVTMDIISYGAAKSDKIKFEQTKSQHDEETKKNDGTSQGITLETARANEVAKWVEGTRAVQPIAVRIARSVTGETRLTEVILERNEQLPNQLVLSMKMMGSSIQQVQTIQTNIEQLNYRAYSPQQSIKDGLIDYRSNLVWQAR